VIPPARAKRDKTSQADGRSALPLQPGSSRRDHDSVRSAGEHTHSLHISGSRPITRLFACRPVASMLKIRRLICSKGRSLAMRTPPGLLIIMGLCSLFGACSGGGPIP
jgi:hypothetical protein